MVMMVTARRGLLLPALWLISAFIVGRSVDFVQARFSERDVPSGFVNYTIDDQDGDEQTGAKPDYGKTNWEYNQFFAPSERLPAHAFNNTWSVGHSANSDNELASQVSLNFRGQSLIRSIATSERESAPVFSPL